VERKTKGARTRTGKQTKHGSISSESKRRRGSNVRKGGVVDDAVVADLELNLTNVHNELGDLWRYWWR
jgi:hypothetical protein